MVPFFIQPAVHLSGSITIHAFGVLIAISVAVGWIVSVYRCLKAGLDPSACNRLLAYVIFAGFIAAHLFSVFAYFPEKVRQDPTILLRFWEDMSSFGGIVGGLCGFWFFFRRKGAEPGGNDRLRYLDCIVYAFPFAWAIGRLGCALAHDHPGTITAFPLGVSLATRTARRFIAYHYGASGRIEELPDDDAMSRMGFHDLGLYEFLYTLLIVVPVFLALDRTVRRPGFFPTAFLLL
ncbi:MAG: prolipoprotein diacylglyceryl transferase family protein, partial [Thermodesulfobacteriota bacterium]